MRDADKRARQIQRDFWPKIRRFARQIPFAEEALAAYYCAFDPQTPTRVRTTLLGALAYFILPIDAVPDLVIGLGFTDDAAILWGALKMVSGHITERHRHAAREALRDDINLDPDQTNPTQTTPKKTMSASA